METVSLLDLFPVASSERLADLLASFAVFNHTF